MESDSSPSPRRPVPPTPTTLEKLTYPEGVYGSKFNFRTGIYDYPDGERGFSKMFKSVKLATVVASFAALGDITLLSQPRSPVMLVGRYLSIVVPAASAAAVFTATNYIVANMRGADDNLNHGVGGCLGGAVLMASTRKPTLIVAGCFFGGVIAALNKHWILENDITRTQVYQVQGLIGHEERYIGRRSTRPGAFTSLAKEPTDY